MKLTPEYKTPDPIEVFDSDTDGDDEQVSDTSVHSKLARKRKIDSIYDDYSSESDTESDPTFNPDENELPKKKKGKK